MKTTPLTNGTLARFSKLRARHRTATCAVALTMAGLLVSSGPAAAQTVSLGTAQNFTVLGGSTVTNAGATIVSGNLGLSPGSAVTGFPPGVLVGGTIHINDALANQAHANAATAFGQLAGEMGATDLSGIDLGTFTVLNPLMPGIYRFNSSAQLTGTLHLSTGGDPNAPFHFQIGSTLTTASSSALVLIGGPDSNVFWQVGTSATIGSGSMFGGNILADQSITFNTGASLTDGRALAINGAVTLDTNNLNGPTAAIANGHVWNGGASNLWSGVNWSPDVSGASSSTLAPKADVVFSVTGVAPQNQNTVLDFDATISSLTINDPAAVTISGPHTLSITGTGITINTGAGLTTINSGLELGSGSSGILVNNTAGLLINGVADGSSGLTKTGTGPLTLTALNTYNGRTTIVAGALEVDGSIAGNTLVSGGVLRGVGSVGGNVANNAAVNPGGVGSPGILTIAGNYNQGSPGALNIRLGSVSDYDKLVIGGIAILKGALNVTYLNGFNAKPGDVFTIATAGDAVAGKFASFNDEHATGTLLTLGVVYENKDVLLEFQQGSIAALPSSFRLTPNELTVARELDKLSARQPANKLVLELDTLPLSQVPGALSLLSPEDFASIFTAGLAISQVQIGNIENRLSEVRQGATGFSDSGFAVSDSRGALNYDGKSTVANDGKTVLTTDDKGGKEFLDPLVASSQRWGFFISGTGEFGDLESTSSVRGSSFTTGGVTVGADYRVTNQWVVGAAVGYANTSSDLSRGGELDFNSGKGCFYGTFHHHGFYLNGIIGGGYSSYDTKRRTVGGFARGETEGSDFNGLLGTGYDYHLGGFTIGPVASIQYSTVGIDSFSEHGALGALRIDSQSQDSLKSAVGIRVSHTGKVGRVTVTPEVRAQWQHEYLTSSSSIDAGFASGSSLTVYGPQTGRDALRLDAGTSVQLTSGMAIFGYYTTELGRENYSVQSVTGGVRVGF